ncbi:AraC family transcriptional regulator [Ruminococcaceae bacterium OttesenSCG-928-I18]|nr:AraC family transcriptional regulator [Ruminococcaceae bacterium OttesenSCG-928-I18]
MQVLDLKESRPRGSFDFPVELYKIDEQHPRYQMSYHWHQELELIRVREGRFSYMVDDSTGVAGQGEVLLVNSGSLHAGTPEKGCLYDCLVFDTAVLEGAGTAGHLLRRFGEHKLLVDTHLPPKDGELARVVEKLFSVMAQKRDGYQLLAKGLLWEFFGIVYEQGYYTENPAQSHGAIRKIQQLKQVLARIEQGYGGRITLEELAETAGMTPKYFCHFFRSMTGRTPIDYLNHHRIEAACARIAAGESNITEVAYDCGFNDLSYFIRVFKRHKTLTPKQYCKMLSPGKVPAAK